MVETDIIASTAASLQEKSYDTSDNVREIFKAGVIVFICDVKMPTDR